MAMFQEGTELRLTYCNSSGKNLQCVNGNMAGRGAEGKWALWQVRRAENGNVRLYNAASDKYLALRDGKTTTGTGGKWTEVKPIKVGDCWVLESIQNPSWHCGVLPSGEIKDCCKTGTGAHAQFKFTVVTPSVWKEGATVRLNYFKSSGKNLQCFQGNMAGKGGNGKWATWEVRFAHCNVRLYNAASDTFVALRDGQTTTGNGGAATEMTPIPVGKDGGETVWVLQSVQQPAWHLGVLPSGDIKPCSKTGVGAHAQFKLTVV